jgi:hypothetical protein
MRCFTTPGLRLRISNRLFFLDDEAENELLSDVASYSSWFVNVRHPHRSTITTAEIVIDEGFNQNFCEDLKNPDHSLLVVQRLDSELLINVTIKVSI